jgi:hypothetical protein
MELRAASVFARMELDFRTNAAHCATGTAVARLLDRGDRPPMDRGGDRRGGHRGQRSIAVSRVPSSPDMQANSFRVNMPGTRSSRLVSEDDILNDNLDCMYETEDRLEQQPGCGGDRGGGMYAPHKRMRTQMVPTQQHTHACGYRH